MDRYLAALGQRPNRAMVGENIYYRSATDTVSAYAAQAHDAFMHSPGHRANILTPQYDQGRNRHLPQSGDRRVLGHRGVLNSCGREVYVRSILTWNHLRNHAPNQRSLLFPRDAATFLRRLKHRRELCDALLLLAGRCLAQSFDECAL